jgi:hypothetical protein
MIFFTGFQFSYAQESENTQLKLTLSPSVYYAGIEFGFEHDVNNGFSIQSVYGIKENNTSDCHKSMTELSVRFKKFQTEKFYYGAYVKGSQMHYRNKTDNTGWTDDYGNFIPTDHTIDARLFLGGLGLITGYQMIFKDKFLLEPFIGAGGIYVLTYDYHWQMEGTSDKIDWKFEPDFEAGLTLGYVF